MLTEPCVMFFSPPRAVLSAILRDEYLTSAVSSNRRGQIFIQIVAQISINNGPN